MSRPRNIWDRLFTIGIVLKGIDGVIELLSGLLLLLVQPGQIRAWAFAWAHPQLSKDPDDVIARYVLHTADRLNSSGITFGAIYLLLHGAVKVFLVVALLRNLRWAYPAMIAVLGLFVLYQVYRIVLGPTAVMIALTLFDVAIIALTVREWREQAPPVPAPQPAS